MIVVSFLYPDKQDATFDEVYYTKKHISRVRQLWTPLGLKNVTPFSRAGDNLVFGPFRALSMLSFDTVEQYNHALENGGEELMQDIANFTNIIPVAQISKQI